MVLDGRDASFLAGLVPLLRAEQRRNGLRLSLRQEQLVSELERLGRAHRAAGQAADSSGRCGPGTCGHRSIVDEVTEMTPVRVPTVTAAGLLGIGDRQVGRLLASGVLSGRKVSGNWLVEVDSIHELIERRELNR